MYVVQTSEALCICTLSIHTFRCTIEDCSRGGCIHTCVSMHSVPNCQDDEFAFDMLAVSSSLHIMEGSTFIPS